MREGEAMGFRELLYFRVVGCLVEQGVRLTPEQKREIFTVFGRRRKPTQGSWLRREGQLVMCGAVPLSMDLSAVSRELRYRYRLLQRPQGVVEHNPAICSGQLVFSGRHADSRGRGCGAVACWRRPHRAGGRLPPAQPHRAGLCGDSGPHAQATRAPA